MINVIKLIWQTGRDSLFKESQNIIIESILRDKDIHAVIPLIMLDVIEQVINKNRRKWSLRFCKWLGAPLKWLSPKLRSCRDKAEGHI